VGKLPRRENSAAARDCNGPWYASAIGGRYSGCPREGRRLPPASGNLLPKGSSRWQNNCGSNQARQRARGRNVSISSCPGGKRAILKAIAGIVAGRLFKALRCFDHARERGLNGSKCCLAGQFRSLSSRPCAGCHHPRAQRHAVGQRRRGVDPASRPLPDLVSSSGLGRLGAPERGHVLVVGVSAKLRPALDVSPVRLRLRLRIDVLFPERPAFSSGSR